MPYTIKKLKTGKYRVTVTHSGQVLAKGTTLKKARAQVRYLGMVDRGKVRRRK